MTQSKEASPTIITLTLPTPVEGGSAPERATATLLIQRGDLAHVREFHYHGMLDDLFAAIRDSHEALGLIEANPPVIPELPEAKPKPRSKSKCKAKAEVQDVADEEPTIDIPLNTGTRAVKISHLKIVGGETDAAAYRQAALLAGRLIDGKLWDGNTPIRFEDVYATAKKMKHLTDKDFSMFTLDDFVQVGPTADVADADVETDTDDESDAQVTLI